MELILTADQTLGGRLSQSRRFRGMSQTAMGKKVGATRRTVSSWEKGETEPTVSQVIHWATATGFPLVWFIEGLDDSVTVGLPMLGGFPNVPAA